MNLKGQSLIGFDATTHNRESFSAVDPSTGKQLDPKFFAATEDDVARAAELAEKAFPGFAHTRSADRAQLLRNIASGIEGLKELLTHRACAETGLPEGRILAETGRTCNQLRMFADLVEEGSWVDARIDTGDPDRQPLPRPDVRSMLRPLGPVAVFGPSNFPLAFSVAGGDTACALGLGNPVIVVAHHAHPGTSELVGQVIVEAVSAANLPEGVFSLLFGRDHKVGVALVQAGPIKAVAFTGSYAGGEALRKLTNARTQPVPFFAEMSSINPVLILPGVLNSRSREIAAGLQGSLTLGVGQFCTNPGLVLIPESDAGANFVKHLAERISETAVAPMLTQEITTAFAKGVESRSAHEDTQVVVRQDHASGAALFETSANAFLANPELGEELFGPATLVVTYKNADQLAEVLNSLGGQLTASVHEAGTDLDDFDDVVRSLETLAGRVIFNAFPTGVEVGHAMVHGGPYPATSDGQHSSVGTRSIYRFLRPVCYQGAPQSLLPLELQDHNPLGIARLIMGVRSRDAVGL